VVLFLSLEKMRLYNARQKESRQGFFWGSAEAIPRRVSSPPAASMMKNESFTQIFSIERKAYGFILQNSLVYDIIT